MWLGATSSSNIAQDWRWVTGEPFSFTDWGPFEPFGNGDRLRIDEFRDRGGLVAWNDAPSTSTRSMGYIVESDDSAQSAGLLVYQNDGAASDSLVSNLNQIEIGDQIALSGTHRVVTEFSFTYRGDFLDHGLDGDEFVKIRFRKNDGLLGTPGTILFESGLIPINPPSGTLGPQVYLDTISIPVPNVAVPDIFTFTIERFGVGFGANYKATDDIAPAVGGVSITGSSEDFLWMNHPVSGWIKSSTDGINDNVVATVRAIDSINSTDILGPALLITSHVNNQMVASSPITLSGTASDAGLGDNGIASVTVNGAVVAGATASGPAAANWSQSVALNPGANLITVVAKDGSANQNRTTQQITIILGASVSIVATTPTVSETGPTAGEFTVSRTGSTASPLMVNYIVSGSATPGSDYVALSGNVEIAAGQSTGVITVTPINDLWVEGNETVVVRLTGDAAYIVGAQNIAIVTILDNDVLPTVSIAATTPSVSETGPTPGVFTVSRSGSTLSALTVNYTVSGTATPGIDYLTLAGIVVVPLGQSSATITVTPFANVQVESNETVVVTLSPNAAYAVGSPNSATVTILNDTPTGQASLITFAPATNFAVGDGPYAVAVGDFNGDGKTDLVVANDHSHNVSILLGNGSGDFGLATNFDVGIQPHSVAVGDFNGDGKQDLAVPNTQGGTASILLGIGNGGFGAATNFAVGGFSTSVAVGDFNGDGEQDLAVANSATRDVSILLGTGTGTFSAAIDIEVGATPLNSVAVGDFNGDGKLDLAVVDVGNGVSIHLGNGSGGFGTATKFAVGGFSPLAVVVGDFNGDGKQDLAVANSGSNNVSILLGNGSGAFGAAINFGVGNSPISVAVGDFNGDGKQDLATANIGSDDVSILLNTSRPTIAVNDVILTEGNSGTVDAVFFVTLSPASSETVTVDFSTAPGTATEGGDYVAQSGTLTFNPGETSKNITVVVSGDTLNEANETFFVNFSNAVNAIIANGQGLGTITNDDSLPTISINDSGVIEGNTGTVTVVFTVTLSSTSGRTVAVNFITANGTATAGSDYVAQSDTLTFNQWLCRLSADRSSDYRRHDRQRLDEFARCDAHSARSRRHRSSRNSANPGKIGLFCGASGRSQTGWTSL